MYFFLGTCCFEEVRDVFKMKFTFNSFFWNMTYIKALDCSRVHFLKNSNCRNYKTNSGYAKNYFFHVD